MAFEKTVDLTDSKYSYTLSDSVKKYTLKDTTFKETKTGAFELTRNLEFKPGANDGYNLKITVNPQMTAFKMIITDKSGLHKINIFKDENNKIIQDKFYFQLDSLVDRDIFIKNEK